MAEVRRRRLRNGQMVAVHQNSGLRKLCRCPRRNWAKCGHPWHFSFSWKGRSYRFSLSRFSGREVESKTDAGRLADELRTQIRNGQFHPGSGRHEQGEPQGTAGEGEVTFADFARIWRAAKGYQLVRARDNDYRLDAIEAFVLPGTAPPRTFGATRLSALRTSDIEAFRHARQAKGLSAVTVNHDLRLLRKMFNWGVREGYLDRTPFKHGSETVVKLAKETPRDARFADDADEVRLLDAANPHLRGVLIALLDTCCRVGEVLNLQWREVDLARGVIALDAAKTKTRRGRRVPMSSRLRAVLEMRRTGPDGQEFGPDDFVFGNTVGERVRSVRTAWENARAAAGLPNLRLADLRHEAASRYEEAGVPTSHVSRILGHQNLTTTTRYLNSTQRMLREASEKLERAKLAKTLQTPPPEASDSAEDQTGIPAGKAPVSH